jgi:hypothetical protein
MTTFDTLPAGKLFALFDSQTTANLSNIPDLTFSSIGITEPLAEAGFVNIFTDDYSGLDTQRDIFGIYVVSVRQDSDYFFGYASGRWRNILYEIPNGIIQAARNRKIVIVIDNQSEGKSLTYANFDGFNAIHTAMDKLSLPHSSVLLINGDVVLPQTYEQWCQENWKNPLFEHVCFTAWPWIITNNNLIPEYPLVLDAVKTESKDFNSLNRTARPHRLEHLYFLIKNDLLKHGLVSGNWTNDLSKQPTELLHQTRLAFIKRKEFSETLWKNLPVEADGPWIEANPDDSPQHIFNHNIYKNSLVTVVTETHFIERDVFLTEKIFKPIAAGHPFLLMGTWRFLEILRKFGYRTDFDMFDDSYDNIVNNTDRFNAVNTQLLKWVSLSRAEKERSIERSMDAVIHNQELFRKHDYIKESYQSLYSMVNYIRSVKHESNKLFKRAF